MPGWTITNWAVGADWSQVAVVNEFITAYRQRYAAVNGSYPTLATKSADDDVQDHSWIETLQNFVLGNYDSFVKSHDSGTKRETSWFGESPQNETIAASSLFAGYATVAELFASAALATSTFRRYTQHPDDGGADLAGVFQVGDIIGHWTFEDLMKVYNVLVWTGSPSVSWIADGANNYAYGEATNEYSWSEARTAAHADWGHESQVDNIAPQAYTAGANIDVHDFSATITRVIAKGQVAAWDGLSRDITWYAYSLAAALDRWIAQGDSEIVNGKWFDWLKDSPAADTDPVKSSVYLAPSLTEPAYWYLEPTTGWEYYGYMVSESWLVWVGCKYALVSWDRSGGFSSY